jgi:hypothetical protein
MRGLRALVTIGGLVAGGCRGETVEPFSGDAASDGDGALETTAEVDATSAELLGDPGFEGPSCYGWGGNGARLQESTDVHTGKKSCLVCSDGTAFPWGIFQRIDATKLVVGTSYVTEGWLRAVATDATVGCDMSASIEIHDAADTAIAGMTNETAGPLLDLVTWNRGGTGLTYAGGGGATSMVIGFGTSSTCGCFLVDDASVHPE